MNSSAAKIKSPLLVTVIAGLVIAFVIYAQPPGGPPQGGPPSGGGWTDDGAVVRLTTDTDKVGIGTNVPLESLHVAGGALLIGGTATSTIVGDGGLSSIGGALQILGAASTTITGNLILSTAQDNMGLFIRPQEAGTGVGAEGALTLEADGSLRLSHSGVGLRITSGGFGDPVTTLATDGDDSTYRFPGFSGILAVIRDDDRHTLPIGTSTTPGCLALGDSDGYGITYITANDGILNATTTRPSNCI